MKMSFNLHWKQSAVLCLGVALSGCNSGGSAFSNPFGSTPPARPVVAQPQLPIVSQPVANGRPTMVINASPQRVQDAITARAKTRGTTVLGANRTGVTLEVPLRASSKIVEDQCGPHKADRTLRVYLETLPNGPGTTVSEDRYVIDGGASSCKLQLTQSDIDDANKSLADLKQQSETTRSASAPRPSDPPGGLAPVNPGRPVVPLR
jgi:hypothetical protein